MAFPFYPGNDLPVKATLWTLNSRGDKIPLTGTAAGTIAAFISLSNGPTATYADAALNTTATYTGVPGKWLVKFSGTDSLTYAILNPLFGSGAAAYLIVTQTTPGAIRIVEPLTYTASRPAVET